MKEKHTLEVQDFHIFSLLFHLTGKIKATQHEHLLAISIRGTWIPLGQSEQLELPTVPSLSPLIPHSFLALVLSCH